MNGYGVYLNDQLCAWFPTEIQAEAFIKLHTGYSKYTFVSAVTWIEYERNLKL